MVAQPRTYSCDRFIGGLIPFGRVYKRKAWVISAAEWKDQNQYVQAMWMEAVYLQSGELLFYLSTPVLYYVNHLSYVVHVPIYAFQLP